MSYPCLPRDLRLATVLGASILFAAPAAHASTFMDTLSNISKTYNLYTSGDVGKPASPNSYSDVEGKVAAGGSAYLRGYEVGLKNQGGDALVVGQNLTYQSGTVHGNVVAGGGASFPTNQGGTTVEGTVAAGGGLGVAPTQYAGSATFSGLPIDFTQVTNDLVAASSFLNGAAAHGQGALGQVTNTWGTLNLTSSASGLVFFDLAASDLKGISGLKFDVDPAATIVINLTGQIGGQFGSYGFLGDVQKDLTLFNFVDATSIDMTNLGFMGSILAPLADLTGTWGQINGSVMVKSYNGTTQMNWAGFKGDLPTPPGLPGAVPEPSAWALMMIGVASLGGILRRRRRAADAVA
jgi:choice-of-anchor A domain-containing protein